MIRLHRLNGSELVVNAELIESLESQGKDTLLLLATGNRVVVQESIEQVMTLNDAYRRRIFNGEMKGGHYVADHPSVVRNGFGFQLSSGRLFLGRENEKETQA